MRGRERRQERRAGRDPGGGDNRYQMREKMVSIGDDFWIENGAGQRVFKVDGKALHRHPGSDRLHRPNALE